MGALLSRFESEHNLKSQQNILRELFLKYHQAAGPGLLTIASRTTDNQTKSMAIAALGELAFQDAGPFVVGCLSDKDSKIRGASAGALVHIKAPNSVPPLTGSLKVEQDPEIVRSLASALGNQGSPTAIPALKSRASDGPTNTRLAVISTIRQLGSRDEAPYLATFLDDKDPFVASLAATVVESESGQNFTWCGKNPCGFQERIQMAKKWWKTHAAAWK